MTNTEPTALPGEPELVARLRERARERCKIAIFANPPLTPEEMPEWQAADEINALQTALSDERERAKRLEAERDDLRSFHDACIKDMYSMLGIDGSDGEYRYKWCAIEISALVRRATLAESRAERVRRETIEAAARICDAMIVDWRERCKEGSEQMGYEDAVLNDAACAIRALSAAGREEV